jgi:hypothetical protein
MRDKIQFRVEAVRPAVPLPVLTTNPLLWVQCKDRRCLAYQDTMGKWTSFYTRKPLADFVKVIG